MNAALFILSLWYVCECMYVGKGVFVCVCVCCGKSHTTLSVFSVCLPRHKGWWTIYRADDSSAWSWARRTHAHIKHTDKISRQAFTTP